MLQSIAIPLHRSFIASLGPAALDDNVGRGALCNAFLGKAVLM